MYVIKSLELFIAFCLLLVSINNQCHALEEDGVPNVQCKKDEQDPTRLIFTCTDAKHVSIRRISLSLFSNMYIFIYTLKAYNHV